MQGFVKGDVQKKTTCMINTQKRTEKPNIEPDSRDVTLKNNLH